MGFVPRPSIARLAAVATFASPLSLSLSLTLRDECQSNVSAFSTRFPSGFSPLFGYRSLLVLFSSRPPFFFWEYGQAAATTLSSSTLFSPPISPAKNRIAGKHSRGTILWVFIFLTYISYANGETRFNRSLLRWGNGNARAMKKKNVCILYKNRWKRDPLLSLLVIVVIGRYQRIRFLTESP